MHTGWAIYLREAVERARGWARCESPRNRLGGEEIACVYQSIGSLGHVVSPVCAGGDGSWPGAHLLLRPEDLQPRRLSEMPPIACMCSDEEN
jgi:hypothetical protein